MLNDNNSSHERLPVAEIAPTGGKIKVKLISPLQEVFVAHADKVLLPAVAGDILILPDRAPIFVALEAGRMTVYNKGEEPKNFFISAGICEVRRNLCPVLAWSVEENKVNPENIKERLKKARSIYKNNDSYMRKKEVATRIDFFEKILQLTASKSDEHMDMAE